jgi:acetyltransferase-like isoleucine patch superfamily enzyme
MRKFAVQCVEYVARRRLLALDGVRIASTAKIMCRKVVIERANKLHIGEGSIIEGSLVFQREGAEIIIGKHSFMGSSLIACATRIEVGDDVLISWGCSIVDNNSHAIAWQNRKDDVTDWYVGKKNWSHINIQPVKINDKCWLGFNVTVLKGVEIGEGAVVGAGSVVTKDVPAWTIVAGNPARMIREIPVEDR